MRRNSYISRNSTQEGNTGSVAHSTLECYNQMSAAESRTRAFRLVAGGVIMASTSARRGRSVRNIQQQLDALQSQLERNRRVFEALYNISLACHGVTSFRQIFEIIHLELSLLFPFDACYVGLSDTSRPDLFRPKYTVDEGDAAYEEDSPLGGLTAQLLSRREPLLFQDLLEERKAFDRQPEP